MLYRHFSKLEYYRILNLGCAQKFRGSSFPRTINSCIEQKLQRSASQDWRWSGAMYNTIKICMQSRRALQLAVQFVQGASFARISSRLAQSVELRDYPRPPLSFQPISHEHGSQLHRRYDHKGISDVCVSSGHGSAADMDQPTTHHSLLAYTRRCFL